MPVSNRTLWVALGVLVLAVTTLGYVWWLQNWEGIKEDSQISYQNGQVLGWSVTSSTCLDTAFARLHPRGALELGGRLNDDSFLRGCLGVSAPTPHLCDRIPAREQMGYLKFTEWRVQECRRRQLMDPGCGAILDVLSEHCARIRARES